MRSAYLERDKSNLRGNLQRSFVGKTTWPPERASLTAIVDLGMSDDCIAKYFNVPPSEVQALRYAYDLEAPTPLSMNSFESSDHPCAGPHPTD
jgi:hypothetical protein